METVKSKAVERESRLERARRVYREYYAMCFWNLRRDLEITEETIPRLVRNVQTYGNRKAFEEAAKLLKD